MNKKTNNAIIMMTPITFLSTFIYLLLMPRIDELIFNIFLLVNLLFIFAFLVAGIGFKITTIIVNAMLNQENNPKIKKQIEESIGKMKKLGMYVE